MIRTLVGVAAVSGVLIVLVYQLTLPIIEAKKAEALRKAVFAVIPDASRVETFVRSGGDGVAPLQGEAPGADKFYVGYTGGGDLAGIALEGQGQGYQDTIKVIYGYDPEAETIVGMKVLESKETPGLGDKIGKDPDFLAHFEALDVRLAGDGRSLRHEIEVVKSGAEEPWQVHAITGATISSNAVGRLLNRSAAVLLPAVQRNLSTLQRDEVQ